MRQRLGILIVVFGVLAVAAVATWGLLRRQTSSPPPPARLTQGAPAPGTPAEGALKGQVEVEGAQVTKRDEQGNLVWALEAETQVSLDPETKQATAQNVRWSLQQGAKAEWIVEAPALVIDYETGRLRFSEGVRVRSADGARRFRVGRLTYEPDSKRLIGEGGAQMESNQVTVTGARLVVDTRARQVRLSGGVRAKVGSSG